MDKNNNLKNVKITNKIMQIIQIKINKIIINNTIMSIQ